MQTARNVQQVLSEREFMELTGINMFTWLQIHFPMNEYCKWILEVFTRRKLPSIYIKHPTIEVCFNVIQKLFDIHLLQWELFIIYKHPILYYSKYEGTNPVLSLTWHPHLTHRHTFLSLPAHINVLQSWLTLAIPG